MSRVQRTSNIPADLDAEKIILGNCILQQSAAPLGDLTPGDFFSQKHQQIARAILGLASEDGPVDILQIERRVSGLGITLSNLNALDDGIPIFEDQHLDRYRQRLKKLRVERDAISASFALGEAARQLAPLDELRERAADFLTKTAPQAAAKKTKAEYSVIPPAAWYGPTGIYRQAMERTCSASDNYHFAGFLTVVGALLGKSVFYDDGGEELYPNLFTVIVGEAGWAKKDSALRRAIRFTRELDNSLTMIYTLASVEGFIDELVREQKELQSKGYSPTPLRVLLRLSELRNLIAKAAQKGTGNIISFDVEPGWGMRIIPYTKAKA